MSYNCNIIYYLLYILSNIKSFLYYFFFRLNSLIFCIKLNSLIFCIFFFKFSSLIRLSSLMDINFIENLAYKFELSYSFWSHLFNFRIFLKLFVSNIFNFFISIKKFFSSSAWLEREIWDMFGLKFLLHGDLRRILTDYGFKGHPLRKHFPLVGYVEARYDDNFQALIYEAVELTQGFRFFKYFNPWFRWKF